MPKRVILQALHSPFALQLTSLTFFLFFLTSFRPPYFLDVHEQSFTGTWFGPQAQYYSVVEDGFLDISSGVDTAGLREVLIEDENGNLVRKVQPRKRDYEVTYIVKPKDNVSKIAHKFNLRVGTILWANDLTAKQTLSVGQKLRIPPADGIYYTVQSGDTLSEIAKLHSVESQKILSYNRVNPDNIQADQELFIPEAQKIFVQKPVLGTDTPAPPAQVGVTQPAVQDISGSDTSLGSIGFRMIRPTKGILTQGYHARHFGIDIGNKLNTPIYAAGGGTVITSADGWNNGYGKYVVIDHGNDVQTLYGHMNERKVDVGDTVKAGQLIGLMGNTGNVYGPTGIHLHLELRIKGRKVNPLNYF